MIADHGRGHTGIPLSLKLVQAPEITGKPTYSIVRYFVCLSGFHKHSLQFIIVAAVAYGIFKVLNLLFFNYGIKKELMVFIFAVIFFLSLISCTVGLMKNLYFADDNKVLITFPVNANLIFISRLIVYYIFELKRSLFLTIPIFIACGI